MMPARYVNVDWVGTAERKGGARLVVRDQDGREASFPRPTTEQSVDAVLAVLRAGKIKLVKVEVRSGLWIGAGARLHCRRWFFFSRTMDVHVWLAVALAERLKAPLYVDDRVFRIESLIEEGEGADAPADDGGFIQ